MEMEEEGIPLGQLEVEKRRRGRWWRRGQSDNQGGKKRIGEVEDNRVGRRGDGVQLRIEGEMEDKCGKSAARSHADAPWEPEHCTSSFNERTVSTVQCTACSDQCQWVVQCSVSGMQFIHYSQVKCTLHCAGHSSEQRERKRERAS